MNLSITMSLLKEQQQQISELSSKVGQRLLDLNLFLVTAESCTGGWIAQAITETAGSSAWFNAGFITYSNEAKEQLLGVDSELIEHAGAVSQEVVELMALGASNKGFGSVAVAVSGVAGPGGGTEEKPVGTVWIGWAVNGSVKSCKYCFDGNREQIRFQTVIAALSGVIDGLN